MALRKFTPDPDLFDPDDDEAWYGTWEHDDGSSFYGQGDPADGRELLAANDVGSASPYGQQNMSPAPPREDRQVLDAGAPMPPKGLDPSLATPSVGQPSAAATPASAWEDDVPPQVAASLRQHAEAAGLSPDALAAVIKHESGWDPSRPSAGDAGKDRHAGLIQFSEKLWPGVAAAAGRPDVTYDEMLAMSAEEQIPFVTAYYKGKGLTPESTEGDYRLATYKPAHLGDGDDSVLDDAASTKGIPVTEQNKRLDRNGDGIINSYEQNASLDKNGDGKVTAGEVRGGPSGGMAPAAPRAGGVPPVPRSIGGLPVSQIQMRGSPLSPGQLEQRAQGVMDRTHQQAAAAQMATEQRIAGRQEATQQWIDWSEQQKAQQLQDAGRQERIAAEARAKIDGELTREVQQVDPKRYLKDLSTGGAVLGALGVILAGLGQAAALSMGMNPGSNAGLDALNKAIDQDVQLQKDAIDRGREDSRNRVAHWTRTLGSAEAGMAAARQEARMHAGQIIQAQTARAEYTAEQKAAGAERVQQILSAGQADAQALYDRENERMTINAAAPNPARDGGPQKLLEQIQSLKLVEQELRNSGMTDEQIAQTFRANGLARLGGETVEQKGKREEHERSDARHAADQARQDNQLDNKDRQAEAAYTTLGAYAQSTPLKRNPETGKWTVPEEAPAIGWKLENRKARQATRMAAIEAFGRLQSDGVISPSEEERFGEMLGGFDTTLEELAENLNAIETIVQARRKASRQSAGGIPSTWE